VGNDTTAGPGWLQPLLRVLNVGPHPAAAQDGWHRIEAYFAAQLR